MKQNLLFIHGFRGNHLGLEEIANCFDKRKFNVFLIDLPPAGEKTLGSYTPLSYAKFVADYIRLNKIEKPILIGHSMGSIITAAVAERYPELIGDKIIFLSPISVRTAPFFAAITPLSIILPNRLITYITTKYVFIPKDKELFKNTLVISNVCGADYVSRLDMFKSARFSSHYSISDFSFDNKKAYMIAGETDRLMPRKHTEELSKGRGIPVVYIKNSGHLINYEKPKETATASKNILRRKKS